MADVDKLSNENYLESIRAHAAFQNPCEVLERDGIFLVAGASNFPGSYWNAAARTSLSVKPKDMDEAARAFFARKKRMFTFSVVGKQDGDLAKYLLENGYETRSEIPCMSVVKPLPVRDVPAGVDIAPMIATRQILDFIELSVAAYGELGVPEKHLRAMFSRPEALLDKGILGVVAYRGAEPVATAFALMSGEGAGLYWVGTKPGANRGGLGSLCTTLATNAAFERGAKVVTLQASKFGEPVYQRLGFETYDTLTRYGPAELK